MCVFNSLQNASHGSCSMISSKIAGKSDCSRSSSLLGSGGGAPASSGWSWPRLVICLMLFTCKVENVAFKLFSSSKKFTHAGGNPMCICGHHFGFKELLLLQLGRHIVQQVLVELFPCRIAGCIHAQLVTNSGAVLLASLWEYKIKSEFHFLLPPILNSEFCQYSSQLLSEAVENPLKKL